MKIGFVGGVRINCGKRGELLSSIQALLGVGGTVFTPNLQILATAQKNPEYKDVLNGASLNIPDGVGVKYILAASGIGTAVFPGIELGEALISSGRFAVIGGVEGRARLAGVRLCERYPSAKCVFAFSGFDIDEKKIERALSKTTPDVCIVCLGAPRQEYFIERIRGYSPKTLYLALGGSVDIYAGVIKRAPLVLRRLGLEWLYRCCRQPKRIAKLPRQISFFVHEFFIVLNKNRWNDASKI